MLPTDILSEEHRIILQVLDCLEAMVDRAKASTKLEEDAANQAVDFIRNFADRCHHGKEEDHLFRLMNERGFSTETGPLAVMYHEHTQGRAFVKGMDEAIPGAVQGDQQALADFAQNAESYVELLRAHIYKEDNILYPMANMVFSQEDQDQLLDLFHHVEHDYMGAGTHEKYLAVARELAERYGVEEKPQAHPGVSGCFSCGH
jgi:hemerythrin-like domain-containing protein